MAKKKRKRRMKVEMIGTDEGDIFVVIDGVKIARRGYPDTPRGASEQQLRRLASSRDNSRDRMFR